MKKLLALALIAAALTVPSANAFFFGWGGNCCNNYSYSYDCCPQYSYSNDCGCY